MATDGSSKNFDHDDAKLEARVDVVHDPKKSDDTVNEIRKMSGTSEEDEHSAEEDEHSAEDRNDQSQKLFLNGDYENNLQYYKERVARGIDVVESKKVLRLYKKDQPEVFLEPMSQLELRKEQLEKWIQESKSPRDVLNLRAILRDYESGQLKMPSEGNCAVYFAGKFIEYAEYNTEILLAQARQRVDIDPSGSSFFEQGVEPVHFQAPAFRTRIAPTNGSHHYMQINISPIVGPQTILAQVMDDTGATFLSIFYDDALALGVLPPLYLFPAGPVSLYTANGVVIRDTVWVNISLQGNPKTTTSRATLSPGLSIGNTRLGGNFLRKALFTDTAPDGNGLLYISEKRAGLNLPVV